MILRLTEDFTSVLAEHQGAPLHVVDAANNHYVLLPVEQYEKVKVVFDQEDIDPSELYPLIDEVMKEDWDDPTMDVYNDYDANRPQNGGPVENHFGRNPSGTGASDTTGVVPGSRSAEPSSGRVCR